MPKFIIKKEFLDRMANDSREIENRGEDVETLYVLFGKYNTNGIEVENCEHIGYKKKNILRKWKFKDIGKKELQKKLKKYMDSETVGFFHNHPNCDKTNILRCIKSEPNYECFSVSDIGAFMMLMGEKLEHERNPLFATILYCGKNDKNLICSNYEILNYYCKKCNMDIKEFKEPKTLELIVI